MLTLTLAVLLFILSPCCVCATLSAGKISEQEVVTQFWALLAAGIGTAFALDT
jgi:hypothetical protein